MKITQQAKSSHIWAVTVISNNVAFWKVLTQKSLGSLILSLNAQNDISQ